MSNYISSPIPQPIIKLDSKGRPLKEIIIGKWYRNPMLANLNNTVYKSSVIFYINNVEIKQNTREKYYYNLIHYSQGITKTGKIVQITSVQSNSDFDQQMVLLSDEEVNNLLSKKDTITIDTTVESNTTTINPNNWLDETIKVIEDIKPKSTNTIKPLIEFKTTKINKLILNI